jgi:hypothetical protein
VTTLGSGCEYECRPLRAAPATRPQAVCSRRRERVGRFKLSGLEGGRRGFGCCRDCCRCGWASCWVRGSLHWKAHAWASLSGLKGPCLGRRCAYFRSSTPVPQALACPGRIVRTVIVGWTMYRGMQHAGCRRLYNGELWYRRTFTHSTARARTKVGRLERGF